MDGIIRIPSEVPGWNAGHKTLLQLLQGPSAPAMSELDRMTAMDALEWAGSVSAEGIAQSIA